MPSWQSPLMLLRRLSGEKVFVTGSISEMMNWSLDNAIPLSVVGSKWSSKFFPWFFLFVLNCHEVTASTSFEYKYIEVL